MLATSAGRDATRAELELVHDARYVAALEEFAAAGGGHLDPDTVVAPGSYRAAVRAAGCGLDAVQGLRDGGADTAFVVIRPPGHHAVAARGQGFCLFNNIAIAAELAIRELGARRVFILDWDVHHGNGTAEAFRRRSDVLFASIHQWGIYPGTGAVGDAGSGPGEGYTINLPVPAGSEEEMWLSLVEHVLLPAALAFEPDLVLISAGFDAHREDPLAGCELETASFAEMARHVRDLARRLEAPLGAVLEGGYAPAASAHSVDATLAALAGVQLARPVAPEPLLTPPAAAQVGRYWPL
jgi:acetoin utilization deacetylase AcuC-like enzyme